MKKHLSIIMLAIVFASPAYAEKPEWAGKGKLSAEQKEAFGSSMKAKEDLEQEIDRSRQTLKNEKIKKEKKIKEKRDELKGLGKQKTKKSEQIQKELEQGSEKGKEARQGRKKWWKFWGE